MYGLWFMKLYVLYVTLRLSPPLALPRARDRSATAPSPLTARTPFAVVASSVLVLMLSRPRSPRAEAL